MQRRATEYGGKSIDSHRCSGGGVLAATGRERAAGKGKDE
jgi:hypothetical protein